MEASVIILIVCWSVVLGIGGGTLIPVDRVSVGVVCLVAVVVLLGTRNVRRWHAALCLCCCAVGWLRAGSIPEYAMYDGTKQVELVGTVVREPELLEDAQRVVLQPMTMQDVGNVQVKTALYPRLQVGQKVQLDCRLRSPEPFDGFAYDRFLARKGIGATCSSFQVEVVGTATGWRVALFRAKAAVVRWYARVVPPPLLGVVQGMLFGQRWAVPTVVQEDFRVTGTAHVLVISGMHIALLSQVLLAVLLRLGLGFRTRVAVFVVCLVAYTVLTGVQASTVRAVVFGVLPLVARLVGRPSSSMHVFVLTAAGMLLANPLMLVYDVGFQLSFSASFGIIVFGPYAQRWLSILPKRWGFRELLSTTLAATVATLPITVPTFQQFSPVGILANMVIVPFVPPFVIGTSIVAAIGLVAPGVAQVLYVPVWAGMTLIIETVHFLAALPFASMPIPAVPAWVPVIGVLCLGLLGWFAYHGNIIHHQEHDAT